MRSFAPITPEGKQTVVSVVTPSYGRFASLLACVKSVQASQNPHDGGIELVVVAAGYSDDEVAILRNHGCHVVVLDHAVSTSDSRNTGASVSVGQYLLFLDDDNVVAPDALWLMSRALDSWSDTVLVGPAMYYGAEPDRIWCAGVSRSRILMKTTFRQRLPLPLPERLPSEDFPNCFMVRRRDFDAVQGFDAFLFPQQWEEGDLARRLVKATGGQVDLVPAARVWHHIEMQLSQRLHLRNASRAYLVARGRAVFTAVYGDKLQWMAYLFAAQWMFGALYLATALWLPRDKRKGVFSAYCRGLRDGLTYGWRARAGLHTQGTIRARTRH